MKQLDTEEKSAGEAVVSGTDMRLTGRWLIIARTAWLVLVIPSVALFVVSLVLLYQQIRAGAITAQDQQMLSAVGLSLREFSTVSTIFSVLTSAIWYGVGFLIFWRRSDDWLALLAAFVLVIFNISTYSNITPSVIALAFPALSLPVTLIVFLADSSLGVFLLLFPNGRLVPRWMWLILLLFLIQTFLSDFPSSSSAFVASWPAWLGLPIFLVTYGAIIYSQIYRYRRVSTPAQRQQTKWVILGVAVAIAGIIGVIAIVSLIPSSSISPFVEFIATVVIWPVALLLIPLSIGFSILRYRLYDIDLLINRTLVYGSLTALLALLYFGLIVALQALFQGVFHQNNAVAIVISTLVIAALFQPLRRRIQAIIDRRFYRRKYDAAKTLATFSATLRNEVDLTELSERLIAVVEETMQPSHVSLWLSPAKPGSKQQTAWRSTPPSSTSI
ncbi:MAG TPA: hypothetical protein VKR83_00225 [Ktedonobacteraceae bacterium]|nr:hypothetical protein [Ktedonobacteraceae bacterium]